MSLKEPIGIITYSLDKNGYGDLASMEKQLTDKKI